MIVSFDQSANLRMVVQLILYPCTEDVAFCRLSWSLVCIQTLFYNCFVHFREFYDRVFLCLIISFFYKEKGRRSKQSKISWQIETFSVFFIVKIS